MASKHRFSLARPSNQPPCHLFEILPRNLGRKKVQCEVYDKLFLVGLNGAADIKHHLTPAKPETILSICLAYILVSTRPGVEAPNMNRFVERCFGSLRREALDNPLLIGRDQIETILEEYVAS